MPTRSPSDLNISEGAGQSDSEVELREHLLKIQILFSLFGLPTLIDGPMKTYLGQSKRSSVTQLQRSTDVVERTAAEGPPRAAEGTPRAARSEEHTSELQSQVHLVCRLLLEKKKHPQAARRSGKLVHP